MHSDADATRLVHLLIHIVPRRTVLDVARHALHGADAYALRVMGSFLPAARAQLGLVLLRQRLWLAHASLLNLTSAGAEEHLCYQSRLKVSFVGV